MFLSSQPKINYPTSSSISSSTSTLPSSSFSVSSCAQIFSTLSSSKSSSSCPVLARPVGIVSDTLATRTGHSAVFVPPFPETTKSTTTTVTSRGSIYLFGGVNSDGTEQQGLTRIDVSAFYHSLCSNSDSKKLEPVTEKEVLPSPDSDKSCAICGPPGVVDGTLVHIRTRKKDSNDFLDRLYLFGGVSMDLGGFQDSFFCGLLINGGESITWTRVNPLGCLPPPSSMLSCTATADGRLHFFGGFGPSISGNMDDNDYGPQIQEMASVTFVKSNSVYEFDIASNTSAERASASDLSLQPSPRAAHTMCSLPLGKKAYIFGGRDETGRLNDLWVLDLEDASWSKIHPAGIIPKGRSFHSSCAIDSQGSFLILGGKGPNDEILDDVHLYDAGQNCWTNISNSGVGPRTGSVLLNVMTIDPTLSHYQSISLIIGGASKCNLKKNNLFALFSRPDNGFDATPQVKTNESASAKRKLGDIHVEASPALYRKRTLTE